MVTPRAAIDSCMALLHARRAMQLLRSWSCGMATPVVAATRDAQQAALGRNNGAAAAVRSKSVLCPVQACHT